MTRIALAPALAFALLASSALADPPKIDQINPLGVRRGEPSSVVVGGSGLANAPVLVAPFPFSAETLPESDGGNFRLSVTVPPSVGLGVYPVRVKTEDGISNPFLLAVGQGPIATEIEDNSTFEQAQPVASPVVVEGSCADSDVDYFKFPGKQGQRIVIDARCARVGSGVDPQIRLTTASRKFVESADDTPGLLTDARLTAVLPEDGDYVVELSDSKYQGGGRPVYRLVIGEFPVAAECFPLGGRRGETVGLELRGGTLDGTLPMAASVAVPPLADIARPALPFAKGLDAEIPAPLEVSDLPELREPADPSAPTVRAAPPVVFNGRIDPAGDEDRLVLAVQPGQSLRIRVDASDLGSALDGTLQVLGANNAVLASAEDTITPAAPTRGRRKAPGINSPDPSLDFAVPAGVTEITLALKDLIGRGGVGYPYRITIEPIAPTYQMLLNDDQINIPQGGNAAIGVTLQRQGYDGPVAVTIANSPAGITTRPLTIPAGQGSGVFTVAATPEAKFGPVDLRILGTGQGPSGPIVEEATKSIVFAQQGTLPTNTMIQVGLPSATTPPLPASLDAPATTVECVHGYNGSILLKVARGENAGGALALESLPLPTGMSVSGSIPENASEGAATVNTPIEAPLGPMNVVVTAKGKLADRDVTILAPAVAVEVVRPATLEIASPSVEVKPGEGVEIKGTLVRKPAFKEPVKITINGLPGGLKADPVDLAPDASEFTLKIQADPGAGAASANVQVAPAFKIGDKDYPFPAGSVAVKVVP